MDGYETTERIHALDRNTLFKYGHEQGVQELSKQGITYAPYVVRVGKHMQIASLELKRILDRRILHDLIAALPNMPLIGDRFEHGYLDVRMYPHSSLSYEEDREDTLFINIVLVLGIPHHDSLDSLTRMCIVSYFDPSAWQEPHDKAFKENMCAGLNGNVLIKLVESLSFEHFSSLDYSTLRYSFEVDGCRATCFERQERYARGIIDPPQKIYISTTLNEELLWESTADQGKKDAAVRSAHFKSERVSVLRIAKEIGLRDVHVALSMEHGQTRLVLLGFTVWSIYDFDKAFRRLSEESELYFEAMEPKSNLLQSYAFGSHDEGNLECDEDYSTYIVESVSCWEPLFASASLTPNEHPWSTPNVTYQVPEITHENADKTVPYLICSIAKELEIIDLDPQKLTSETSLYLLMGSDDVKTKALHKGISKHFNEEPFFRWITVGHIIEVAKIAIWPASM